MRSTARWFVVVGSIGLLAACSSDSDEPRAVDDTVASTTSASAPTAGTVPATTSPTTSPTTEAPAPTTPASTAPPTTAPATSNPATTAPAEPVEPTNVTEIPSPSTFAPAWMVQIGTPEPDTGFAIDTVDGLVVAAFTTEGGVVGDGNGTRNVVVAGFGTDGTERWSTQFGTDQNDSPLGVSIAGDAVYVGGVTEGDLAAEAQGSADVWLARFDLDGNEQWRQQFGADGWDRGFDVTAADTGVYITGYTASTLDPDTDTGGFDAYVAKFDDAGNLDWIRQIGTDATDWGQGSSLAPDGGVYVTGYTEGDLAAPNAGDKDAWVARLAPNGDTLWIRQIGSAGLDWTQGVATTADGGVLLAGSSDGSLAAVNQGDRDVLIASFDADGEQRFVTQFGSAGLDSVYEVREVGDQIVAHGTAAGDLGNPLGDNDALFVTLDADGTLVDVVQYGTEGSDDGTGLAVGPDGSIYFVTYTTGDLAAPNAGRNDVVIGRLG